MYINCKREFRLNRLSIALLAAGLVAQPLIANAAPRTTVTNLATLGGSTNTAAAINDSGQVVGYSYIAGNTAQHAFLYSNGSMTELGTFGGTYSIAYAINASGQVAGYAYTAGNAAYHAFLYRNGSMTDLGTFGGTYSQANGINASGQVMGFASTTAGDQHAFLYGNGSMTDLGTLGGTYSYANAINASGQVVGSATTALNAAQHAFLYSNGSMTDLGTLGGTYSQAYAINASGQVVGAANTATGSYHAFLNYYGSMKDLGTLGGTSSQANAINDSGQIVGYARTAAGDQHAFLYGNGTMYDLSSLAPSGVTYYSASSINRYAQIAVNGSNGASILTLHPDWQGGNGYWDDWSNTHWNYSGLGAIGLNPGAPHDVVINPTGSATILGSADATVRTLTVGGAAGQIVTLNLNSGSTATTNGTILTANGVIAGSGRLAGGITTQTGSTIKVLGGENMQLTGGTVANGGMISVTGASTNAANLSVSGTMNNFAGAQIALQNANASFSGNTTNVGQIALQNSNATFGGATTNAGQIALQNGNATFSSGMTNAGQVIASYGNNNVTGAVTTSTGGKIILSGNSTTTFYNAVDVQSGGELRISTGSSATFFGQVYQRTGSIFSGTGTKFYEGGLSVGASPGLGIDLGNVSFGSGNLYLAEIGGITACTADCATNDALKNSSHDKYVVGGHLTFGGTLKLASWNGFTGQAGQSFDLFDWGSADGTFSSIDSSGLALASGTVLDTSQLYTSGVISVQAVPEADTWAMLLAGLGLMGFVARRRKGA
jgi:probable HAF family extracellular repeat protein